MHGWIGAYPMVIATIMMTKVLLFSLILGPVSLVPAAVRPMALRCEHLHDPVGLDVTSPRLSWKMEDPAQARGRKQSAYRVLVASSRRHLEKDQADL
jgi:alpha-L-rhamnosidase